VKTISDFKKSFEAAGGFKQAVLDIREMIGLKPNSLRSWKGLHELYIRNKNPDQLFVSEEAKLIFALTQMEGEKRAEILGIEKEMYSSLSKSKLWYRKLTSKLHPDRLKHPLADDAVAELNNIYARMKKYGE
jgi:hypothetical protein